MSHILILSDGRAGHFNQSIAFAKYMNQPYEIVKIEPKYRWSKSLSYACDKIGFLTTALFAEVKLPDHTYDMVVGAGSTTYYMVKVVAKRLNIPSVTMMLPRGYRYNYDTIFAQKHDQPPRADNIVELPANFAYVEPKNIYTAKKKSVAIIVGGDNKLFKLSTVELKKQLDFIVEKYKGYEVAITTSPRTSREIETLIESYQFDYQVIFSKNPMNPIPDFLDQCETVFITMDSTSMVSEAVSYGKANIVVLPLVSDRENKFERFAKNLAHDDYLFIFNGDIKNKNRKIDFSQYLQGAIS